MTIGCSLVFQLLPKIYKNHILNIKKEGFSKNRNLHK